MKYIPYYLPFCLILLAPIARADEPSASMAQRYTFSWPLADSMPVPRGGMTRGADVILDATPSPAWHAVQEAHLSDFERDRRAILALAGDYRVTFDFLEIVTFNGKPREQPYQSWGTERVYLDEDRGKYLSIVHILEMHILQKDGTVSEPLVTKHWREDWQYEPRQIIAFKGEDRWESQPMSRRDSASQWSQTVAQVDESPRYASVGRWGHNGNFSTWLSTSTWRPLPRRELSVRKDYQVLLGTNRVTLTGTGSIQEENNLKMVLGQDHQPDRSNPFLAREYGVARYERIRDADFAEADQYYKRTRHYWQEVHGAWSNLFQHNALVVFNVESAQTAATRLSDYADQLAGDRAPDVPEAQIIRETLQAAVGNGPL